MQIEYITSISDGIVRFYRSDYGYEGFDSMSIARFMSYLDSLRRQADELGEQVARLTEEG